MVNKLGSKMGSESSPTFATSSSAENNTHWPSSAEGRSTPEGIPSAFYWILHGPNVQLRPNKRPAAETVVSVSCRTE